MLYRIKNIFLILFLSSLRIFSQNIESIKVTGNDHFSEADYIQWSGIRTGENFLLSLPDSIKKNISFQLGMRGYFFSDLGVSYSADSSGTDIEINIREGEPSAIRKINFEGADPADSINTLRLFGFMQGEIFNKFELEENISEALNYYENNGYPFASITILSVNLERDTVNNENFADLLLKINKGKEKNIISKIEIRGNTSTKDYVVIREMRIGKGSEYSQKEISEVPRRLNRLRFFNPVKTPQFYYNPANEGVLLVEVSEKQTNNFDGIIGYIPGRETASGREKGYLTGLVNVSLRNLFGTGRSAAVRWQQLDRYSQELELKYLEPWILGYPFNITGGLFQRKQDTIYVQRRLDGAVEYLATEDISAAVFISAEEVIPAENTVPVFTVYNSSLFTTGVNIKFDTRDDPYAPLEGILFINEYSFSRKKINGPLQFLTPELDTRINLQRLAVSFSGFYEVFSRQVIALGLHGRELKGSFFENSDLYRLGGTNSLRGYRENQFLGSRIFWSNLEYRLLLTPRSYAFVFFDTGYYLREADPGRNILKTEDFLPGYGAGLSIETGIGILAVSYALGEGDSFGEGKIHFGIVNEF